MTTRATVAAWLGLRSGDVGPARRSAIRSISAALAASVLAAGLFGVTIVLSRPCLNGAGRFNWDPVALALAFLLATLSALLLLTQRRAAARRRAEGIATWAAAAGGVAICAIAFLLCLSAVFLVAATAYDPAGAGCATF